MEYLLLLNSCWKKGKIKRCKMNLQLDCLKAFTILMTELRVGTAESGTTWFGLKNAHIRAYSISNQNIGWNIKILHEILPNFGVTEILCGGCTEIGGFTEILLADGFYKNPTFMYTWCFYTVCTLRSRGTGQLHKNHLKQSIIIITL